jgi:hypothetical protein
MFALKAWPDGGFAEMTVDILETKAAAEALLRSKQEKHPKWRFRVVEVEKAP